MSAVTRRALKAQTDPQEPAVSLAQETSDEVTVGEINVHVAVTPGEHATTVRFQLVDPAGKPLTDLSSRLIF